MSRTEVIIDILVNSRDSARELEGTASKFDSFGSTMEGLAAPAGVALAAIGGMALGAAKAASDLQQASGGVDAVFKTSADQVHKWAESSAQDVGLSSAAYDTMAAGIGGALTGMGVPLDQAAQSTHDLMLRAADLASVFGGTTAQATEAVNAAFRGEYDSLQRLIPSINAAAVEAQMKAEADSGMTYASEEAAKAAAITNLIMDKSAGAAGNFAKEADTAAGAQARAQAEFTNTAAALGEQLLPAITTVMGWLTSLGSWVSEHIGLVTTLAVVIGGFAAAILAANVALSVQATITAVSTATIGGMTIAEIAATAATWAFNAAMAVLTSPITLIVLAIGALIAIIVLLVKNWDTVSAAAGACWDFIVQAAGAALDWIKGAVSTVLDWISGKWDEFAGWVSGIWDKIKGAAGIAWEAIKVMALAPIIAIQFALEQLQKAALVVWDAIKTAGSAIWSVIQKAAETALKLILAPINAIKEAISWVITKIKEAISWAKNLASKVPFLGSFFGASGNAAAAPSLARSAPSLMGVAPRLSTRRTAAAPGGLTINVSGALDPVAVAKQLRAILVAQERRETGVRV